jgi:hypothetical protein
MYESKEDDYIGGILPFQNSIGLPDELAPMLINNWPFKYASMKKD